jgi:hypothetical protein
MGRAGRSERIGEIKYAYKILIEKEDQFEDVVIDRRVIRE